MDEPKGCNLAMWHGLFSWHAQHFAVVASSLKRRDNSGCRVFGDGLASRHGQTHPNLTFGAPSRCMCPAFAEVPLTQSVRTGCRTVFFCLPGMCPEPLQECPKPQAHVCTKCTCAHACVWEAPNTWGRTLRNTEDPLPACACCSSYPI